MKIFSQNQNQQRVSEEGHKKSKTKRLPEKLQLSEQEIREKMAAHVQSSNSAKAQMKVKGQALGSGFMNPDIKPQVLTAPEMPEEKKGTKESHLLLSDVKLNDPKDSNTQEKLRTALRSGAFNFNPKERETLEKILGNA